MLEIGSALPLSPLTEKHFGANEYDFTEVLTLQSNVALAISNELALGRLENSVCGLGTHPSQHFFKEFGALFLVRVGSSQEKGFTYTGDTLTFAGCDCFNLLLQV